MPAAGDKLGSYELEALIGTGGFGSVWRASRPDGDPVALKLLHEELVDHQVGRGPNVSERFLAEARLLESLSHPGLVRIFEVIEERERRRVAYAMELLQGRDLGQCVDELDLPTVLEALAKTADTLGFLHEHEIVHRDVKPANIFLCQMGVDYDYVKVLDFGLVGLRQGTAEDHTKLTEDGVIFGTPAYLAPEAALPNGAIGPASDVYSLGCVGYWLLTGALVFEDDRPMQTILDHLKKPPPPISTRTELDVPSDLERVIMSCLEKDPTRRPADAGVLMEQLAACALADAWSLSDARRWWALHLPHERSESSLDAQPIVPRPGVKSGKKPERGRR